MSESRDGAESERLLGVLARNERWLRTVVVARSGDPGAVDEIVQEVALAAVRTENVPAEDERLAPWLYRVAVRQSLLHRRRIGRRRRLNNGFSRNGATDESREPDPLDWLLRDERREQVRVAIDRLSHRDAEMLLLKYTEDWDYRRIAAHTGATVAAVESRLHRARARLRRELAALHVVDSTENEAR